ncbi:MAG: helix-turn-helix domain-containing protein, partial [Bacteroidales bacterium]
FKFLADMKREVSELRTLVKNMMNGERCPAPIPDYGLGDNTIEYHPHNESVKLSYPSHPEHESFQEPIIIDEDHYSIEEVEKELIKKALEKNHHKRKNAADELGISERTLYRKIKEYGL